MTLEPILLPNLRWQEVVEVVGTKLRWMKNDGEINEKDFSDYYIVEEQMERVALKQCGLKLESIAKIDVILDFQAQQIRFTFHDTKRKTHQGKICLERRSSTPTYTHYHFGAGKAIFASIRSAKNDS